MADLSLEQLWSRTVWQTLIASAERFPDKPAIVAATDAGEVERVTYRALVERAASLSAGLANIGVRRGDRVALWMTNTVEWVISAYAAMRIGGAIVPINTFLRPVEVKYFLAQSGARHLLMIDAFRQLRFPDMLAEICPEFAAGARPGFLYSDELPELRNVVVAHRGEGRHDAAIDFASLEAGGRDSAPGGARQLADRMEQAVTGRDLAMIKYTSGSTGWPKGAMLEQGGMIANAILHARRWEIGEADVWFSMMPLFHAGGSIQGLFTMLVSAGTLVFTEAMNADQARRLLASERATVFFGLGQTDVIAAALPAGETFPALWFGTKDGEAAGKVFPNVRYQMSPYGLTEGYAVVAITSPSDPPEKQATTAGRIIEGDECRIVDPRTGIDVARGEIGEAWIRGMVMRGYWNKPEETARAIDGDGWLHTEDLLSRDSDGYVTYHGRLKLMLKVGGENVSIEEVERTVASHDAVAECGAVGVPDRKYTEVVRVYVVPAPNHALAEGELRDWLKARLAQFKRPRDIIFLDALPKLGNGKLDRVNLAALASQASVPS
jgi:fatty-acyl-CoA synthase